MATRRMRLFIGCFVVGLLGAVDAGWCADNLVFVPLASCRVIDTRQPGAGGPMVAGTPRTFVFRGPTRDYQNPTPFPNQGGTTTGCGIPDLTNDGTLDAANIAQAVVLHITAVSPSGSGDIKAWPANPGQEVPVDSVLNYAPVTGLSL